MTTNKILNIIYSLAMALLLVGIIMHIVQQNHSFWIYLVGLIPVVGIRAFNLVIGKSENFRKNLILVISAFSLLAAGAAIFYDKSFWVIFITISAVLDLYISFRKFN